MSLGVAGVRVDAVDAVSGGGWCDDVRGCVGLVRWGE